MCAGHLIRILSLVSSKTEQGKIKKMSKSRKMSTHCHGDGGGGEAGRHTECTDFIQLNFAGFVESPGPQTRAPAGVLAHPLDDPRLSF